MSAPNRRLGIIFIVTALTLTSCFWVVFGDEASLDEEDDSGREMREYMPETWHAVETIPEGATGWIPRDPIDGHGIVYTKRRRLRKRKRRPPIVSYLDQSAEIVEQIRPDVHEETKQVSEDINLPLKNTRYGLDETEHIVTKKRKRPNTGDPWEELQEESVRPYIRRKVTPAYQEPDESTLRTNVNSNHNPLSASIRFGSEPSSASENDQYIENKSVYYTKTAVPTEDRLDKENEQITFIPLSSTTQKTPKLKDILKQNGGLSLSEILQQKNITLAELLMGKKEAIKALTETSEIVPTTIRNPYAETVTSSIRKDYSETTKYKRLPPSIALRKDTIHRRYEQNTESYDTLSDKEMMEAQRKRISLLHNHGYKSAQNSKFKEVTRYEVVTEPTTEKRIFVPSHPKLYTSVDYKPELEELTVVTETFKPKTPKPEVTTEKLRSTTQKLHITEPAVRQSQTNKVLKLNITKSKAGLPMTSAKLMKMTTTKSSTPTKVVSATETSVMEEENYPNITGLQFKPIKINVKDVFGFQNLQNLSEEKVSDEPLRMSIDLDTVVENTTPTILTRSSVTTPVSTINSTEVSSIPLSTQIISKLKPYTAKEEILEILKDPMGRAGLARILEARNMTIQELIDQRERGSSQLHLADIFHNKTREPEPSDEALEGKISSEVFTSFPIFARRPKNIVSQEITSKRFAEPVESSSQSNLFPSFKIEVLKDRTEAFPWKQLYPELFQDKNNDEKLEIMPTIKNEPDTRETKIQPADILTEEDIQRIEDIDQSLYSSVSNEQLNLSDENSQKLLNVSPGVKSAIIASLAIVTLSIIVFVTILFIFKWTQKKKKLNYTDSMKPPLFDVKRRNIKTFVAETLGKTKVNYYKRHLQSMSDDGWDNERNNVF